jgi:hypothetical protein
MKKTSITYKLTSMMKNDDTNIQKYCQLYRNIYSQDMQMSDTTNRYFRMVSSDERTTALIELQITSVQLTSQKEHH